MRIAVVQTHPIQYFSPLWRALSAVPDVELRVLYLSTQGVSEYRDAGFDVSVRWDIALLDGYQHEFVSNTPASATRVAGFWSLRNVALIDALRRFAPDVCIVLGYEHAAKWLAYAWCVATRTPYVIRGESNLEVRRTPLRALVKRAVLQPLYRRASAVAAIGRLNAEYSMAYGAARERVVVAPYSVDDARFIAVRNIGVSEARSRFSLPQHSVLALVSGKLIPRKRPLAALNALAKLAGDVPDLHLVFLGDGQLRSVIEADARALGLAERVHVLGFVNQADTPLAYRACDFLIFPSAHETWGVVVNEAMHVGLPVITTDRVGAAADLIVDGETGFCIARDDQHALVQAMRKLAGDRAFRTQLGLTANQRAGEWGLKATVSGFLAACNLAKVGRVQPPAGQRS